jgi:hypothetical protein
MRRVRRQTLFSLRELRGQRRFVWPECHSNNFMGMVPRKAGALDGEGVGSDWMVWEPVLLNPRGRAAEI